MIEVFRKNEFKVTWNQEATFHLEREIHPDKWVEIDIMTSYGALGVEDAQTKAMWWVMELDKSNEEQKDAE